MAYLACVYVEPNAGHRFLVADCKLTTLTIYCSRYAEDLLRIKALGILEMLAITPIDMLVCQGRDFPLGDSADSPRGTQEIMGDISQYKPQSEILYSWEEATGLPWDPFDSCAVHTQRGVVCPKCGVVVAAR